MSVHYTVRCETHDTDGPDVRVSGGSAVLWPAGPGPSADPTDLARTEWAAWLNAHEWCDLAFTRSV